MVLGGEKRIRPDDDNHLLYEGPEKKYFWVCGWPKYYTEHFEEWCMGEFTQALQVNPKMDHILPVFLHDLLEESQFFHRQAFQTINAPYTTWFWEAEEGDALTWNQENVQRNWEGSITW